MKSFFVAVMMFLSLSVSAATISVQSVDSAGFDKLTPTQRAEIVSMVAKNADANANASTNLVNVASQPERVEQWVNIGTKIGAALGGAAKEVGVQVNDFAQTPVGKVTMMLIVWNYLGSVVVHVFGGVLVMLIGIFMIMYVARLQYPADITYDYEKLNWRGKPTIRKIERRPIHDSNASWYLFLVVVTIAAGLACIFSF